MIVTSGVVMFGLMYLNTYELDHVFFSQTRMWMAFVMTEAMALIMLVVFIGALWLVRSQQSIDDVFYMRAMIPHHSIAILTSERAHIRDPRVRKLAHGIIEAEVREIGEMKALIRVLSEKPGPTNQPDLPARPAQ